MFNGKHSLQIHIASLFFLILSVTSVLLIGISFQNSKSLNEKLAQERMNQSAEQIKLSFQKMTASVFTSLNSLSASHFASQLHEDDEDQWIDLTHIIMRTNPDILSIYLGFDDERSFFFRNLHPAFMKTQFSAPPHAVLMVDINQTDGVQIRRFYDNTLSLLTTRKGKIEYRPTQRSWFKNAPSNGRIHITPPYLYKFIDIRGVTFSKRLENDHAVIAFDVTVASFDHLLQSLTLADKAQIVIFDANQSVIAQRGFKTGLSNDAAGTLKRDALSASPLHVLFETKDWAEKSEQVEFKGQTWAINLVPIDSLNDRELWLAKAVPEKELIRDAIDARNNQIALTLLMLTFGIIMILWASNNIARRLKTLNKATKKIRNLNFDEIHTPQSNIIEISNLSTSFSIMSETIHRFLETLQGVSKSSNFEYLLADIVMQCQRASQADFVLMWSHSPEDTTDVSLSACYPRAFSCIPLSYPTLLEHVPHLKETLKSNQPFAFTPRKTDIEKNLFPYALKRAWVLPLFNRNNQKTGCVFIGFNRALNPDEENKIHFIQTFLNFISLIKENREHIAAQKELFSSLVEMIASAIDTKSPYTGAHCQRVPILTFMLAEAASEDTRLFPDFHLDDRGREALHIAGWLHDCGKVTTPEYVVDKATKLETIYNRIHEIRTRFEVLKRDAQIVFLKKKLQGDESQEDLQCWLDNELQALDDDFAFIAHCNMGETQMNAEKIKQLELIAQRVWYRTIDDNLGLSNEEHARRARCENPPLPCKEPLLKNSVVDEIPWSAKQQQKNAEGTFNVTVPDLQYNRGEIYNLSIRNGTLTQEERFIINDHIIQTINMLKKLPYPDHLSRVTEIAGGHHEKLDGRGYPMGLKGEEICIETRMMTIADIFEALTACDRPYKKAKTLSQALRILAFMAKEKHIDTKLFTFFIEKKIYLQYAHQFLPQEQWDTVNENEILHILELDK